MLAIHTANLIKGFKTRLSTRMDEQGWVDGIGNLFRLFTKKELMPALSGIDLRIGAGEFFGILGPNGAGKTTLIKVLATLLYPDSGWGHILGYDLFDYRQRRIIRGLVSFVASGHGLRLFPRLTVKENLELCARHYGLSSAETKEKIDMIFDLLKLGEHQDKTGFILSGGTRQKLAIARALLLRTPILLLDEPTINLDPVAASDVREFVKKCNLDFGQTILLATHYVFEAEQLCDRVAIMDRGRIIACDTPSNLKSAVQDTDICVMELEGLEEGHLLEMKSLPGVKRLASRPKQTEREVHLLRIHTDEARRCLPTVLSYLSRKSVKVRDVRREEITLEDVYLDLSGRGGH